jgi:hypothetical protein
MFTQWDYIRPFLGLPITMIGCHFLADFPLQGNYVSAMKDPNRGSDKPQWWIFMTAHCAIQALFVYLLTAGLNLEPTLIEFVAHFVIDWLKAKGKISFLEDQIAHIFCKLVYCLLLAGTKWMFISHA